MAVIGDPLTFTYTVTSSSGDAGIKDGTSNTIMFGEVVQVTSRLFVGNLTFDSHGDAPMEQRPGASSQVTFSYQSQPQPLEDVPTTKITLEGFDVI